MNHITRRIVFGLSLTVLVSPGALHAHCDTLEGPVVLAAREALAKGDVTPVFKWVKSADEDAIRAAFVKTAAVRRQSETAAELADTWFFETLVRIHRAGEGAPYTGLKSDAAPEPGIAAADRALASGNIADVIAETVVPLQVALKTRFDRVMEHKPHANESLDAGRGYVEAYVDYVHFAERLATLAAGSAPEPNESHAEHGH